MILWIFLAITAWLVTGTLMLATRDPEAFAHTFWGAVTVVLWPIALISEKVLERRRATATVPDQDLVAAQALGYERGVRVITDLVTETSEASEAERAFLSGPIRACLVERVESSETTVVTDLVALMAGETDPRTLHLLNAEAAGLRNGLTHATEVVYRRVAAARSAENEGDVGLVPLLDDVLRDLDRLPGTAQEA